MGRSVDVDHLVGATEIARRLGVGGPELVHLWRRRHSDFPRPLVEISRVLIWDWVDVQAWAQATGRLRPGDPWWK